MSAKSLADYTSMAQSPACKHEHTRLIAKDNEAEYIECVDCGAILETHELAEAPIAANPKACNALGSERKMKQKTRSKKRPWCFRPAANTRNSPSTDAITAAVRP